MRFSHLFFFFCAFNFHWRLGRRRYSLLLKDGGELARLRLDDLENQTVVDHEEEEAGNEDFKFCLVGKVLTGSSVHFP